MNRLILLILICLPLTAQTSLGDDSTGNSKTIMRGIFQSMTRLHPYMNDQKRFESSRNERKILRELENISASFARAHGNRTFKKEGFRPSLSVVKEHIDDTVGAFKEKHKTFALSRLKSTTQLCMSCHSQMKMNPYSSIKDMKNSIPVSIRKDPFSYAEFLQITGNYGLAQLQYVKAVDQWLKDPEPIKSLYSDYDVYEPLDVKIYVAFKQVMVMNIKSRFAPRKARAFLKRYENNSKIPGSVKADAKEWLNSLENILKDGNYNELNSDQEVRKFVLQRYKNIEDEVELSLNLDHLAAEGFLLRYLNDHPKTSEVASILYHASIGERQIHRSLFYSLSDFYLKECMNKFSDSPYAKKCYSEYEKNLTFGYTGSAGTDIPEDEKRELAKLKKKVFGTIKQ